MSYLHKLEQEIRCDVLKFLNAHSRNVARGIDDEIRINLVHDCIHLKQQKGPKNEFPSYLIFLQFTKRTDLLALSDKIKSSNPLPTFHFMKYGLTLPFLRPKSMFLA